MDVFILKPIPKHVLHSKSISQSNAFPSKIISNSSWNYGFKNFNLSGIRFIPEKFGDNSELVKESNGALRVPKTKNTMFIKPNSGFKKRRNLLSENFAIDKNHESSSQTFSNSEITHLKNMDYDAFLDIMNNSTKWIVSLSVLCFAIWFHDLNVAWFVIGSIWNGALAKLLKRIINQPRPNSASTVKKDPGMPSSHSQSIFFVVTYAIASLISLKAVSAIPLMASVFLYSSAFFMSWLRVNRGLHTYDQIFVGSIIGLMNGFFWNEAYFNYVLPFSLSDNSASRQLNISIYSLAILSIVLFGLEVGKRWLKDDHVN